MVIKIVNKKGSKKEDQPAPEEDEIEVEEGEEPEEGNDEDEPDASEDDDAGDGDETSELHGVTTQGHATVESTDEDGATDTIHEEVVNVHSPGLDKHVSMVTLEMGATIPTAPYANVKISVGLTMPCNPGDEDIAFDASKNWIDQKMEELVSDVEASAE